MTMGRTAVRSPALLALYLCIGIWFPILGIALEIKTISSKGSVGGVAKINCTVAPEGANIEWLIDGATFQPDTRKTIKITEAKAGVDNDGGALKTKTSLITITNVTADDGGEYTCAATLAEERQEQTTFLDLRFEGKLVSVTKGPLHVNVSSSANFTAECVFYVYNMSEVRWSLKNEESKFHADTPKPINATHYQSVYTKRIHNPEEDNGTYVCEMIDSVSGQPISGTVDVLVYDKPKVILDELIAINTSEVYMKWTLLNYNSMILNYFLFTKGKNDSGFLLNGPIKGGQTGMKNMSFVIGNLNKSTEYEIMLEVKTAHGTGRSTIKSVTTLAEEPIFVPNISINGFSATSVTIGWAPPEKQKEQYIHYYLLEARKIEENEARQAYHPRDNRNLPYMFDNLEPHSTYVFRVRACSDYGDERCGPWSAKMEAATLDGLPSKPVDVVAECGRDHMNLTWGPPEKPNAEIKGYTMELRGWAAFTDRHGLKANTTWGPLSKFKTNVTRKVTFDDLQPNTLYTVQISAMTRTRRRGQEETANCTTELAPPDQPPRPRWRKILVNDEYRFKMYLPRISERNGPICCYRVYMVRLRQEDLTDWNSFPSPKDLPVITYTNAHSSKPDQGAYMTDIFSNVKGFPPNSEIVLGDNETIFNKDDPTFKSEACRLCLERPSRKYETTSTSTTTTTTSTTPAFADDDGLFITMDPIDNTVPPPPAHPADRRRRDLDTNYSEHKMMGNGPKHEDKDKELILEDGKLNPAANYTLFVELISGIPNEPPLFSNYMNVLMPAPTAVAPQPVFGIEIALQATCAIAAVVLLLMIVFCIRQTRRSRKMPPHAHLELNPLQLAYRYITGLGGRAQMVPSAPPNMPPIAKEDLAAAYAERQADSDFGFQKEFECINYNQYKAERMPKTVKLLQLLPECFPDRTTHASDARENQPKNRYPDIKAYDQTRVKLSQIDSITGSDYINANYVNGYQDRKRFICAQGPTDTTINDFWRMIWEHGLELIVMLTNLEEYSKVKCSKYWPDEVRGARAFGNITVQHVAERRYSDYIVRELRITKQAANSESQPVVENNGVAKRNGDCKEPGDSSVPTSPREVKDADSRIVKQYHFLMWKDFAAPEHAYSILKFIKRVNEAWSSTVVRPCVVHCSAGVGRTGTLVALDCLLEQLRSEGHAAVFNTIAELRRQRNFLVQSPKQYIFVYRALVEFAHYGDTEIPACRLKSAIDRLRNTPPGGAACLMEIEFEKILNSPIPEPVKSCTAGAAEELRSKNRSQDILPYDRNRVILAPIPTRDYSTYINASFIEAYDNSESFIITQDPLPSTITDFWRMVSEHNVSTIVMLSELGDGKCPRYWDDGTATYDHISVQYEESESCPYYTRRQFRIVNNKCGTTQSVLALQYQGWPTAVGAVPEVTRGLAELADAAACHPCTMLAHCQLGTERSALFVALCILISQLRAERRVDVCTVARKVRSQRVRTIDTFLHYEFLHRAILNYAELHNLLEDS